VVAHTPGTGVLTATHIGIMGTMAQTQLADLRDKTKCGQLGRVRASRIPGGLAHGYDVVPQAPGLRRPGNGGSIRHRPRWFGGFSGTIRPESRLACWRGR